MIIAAVLGLIAVIVIVCVIIIGVAIGSDSGYGKKLKLGEKYLTDMDYENAILAFKDAISINPKNEDAYIGLADAYMSLAEDCMDEGDEERAAENLNRAITELEIGLDNIDSTRIEVKIKEIENKKMKAANPPSGEDKKNTEDDYSGEEKKAEDCGSEAKEEESKKEPEENKKAEVYQAYLDYLTSHPECRIFDRNNNLKKSISIIDGNGDDNPLICYEKTYTADIGEGLEVHLSTGKNGNMEDIFITDLGAPRFAAVGGSWKYEFYIIDNEIYDFYSYGEAGEMGEELSVLEESGGSYHWRSLYSYLGYPSGNGDYIDEYKKEGNDIPGNDYKRSVGDTLYGGILFYEGYYFYGANEYSDANVDMMTYDEAIAYRGCGRFFRHPHLSSFCILEG